ncbi:hypothetical protein BOX15_Mlig024746g1 [Macrostomum lignano]|uniref:TNFR-Cys domain-containing protein n=1 Tax=Macrostomum lignano TaxID=282301 RepID=A0A267FV64_9PLAT|nr:hypothetical protein BOX15_Mlig024746g1 [Macrostomum lignano]
MAINLRAQSGILWAFVCLYIVSKASAVPVVTRCRADQYYNSLSQICESCPKECLLGTARTACTGMASQCQPLTTFTTLTVVTTHEVTTTSQNSSGADVENSWISIINRGSIGVLVFCVLVFLFCRLFAFKRMKKYYLRLKLRRSGEVTVPAPETAGPEESEPLAKAASASSCQERAEQHEVSAQASAGQHAKTVSAPKIPGFDADDRY